MLELDAPRRARLVELFHWEKVQFNRVPSTPAILTLAPPRRAIREDSMHKAIHKAWITAGLALMLSCVGSAVSAQTTPQEPQQPQDVLTPAPKLNLTLEQRHTIREFVKDMKPDAADVKTEIGDPIPQGINPRPMPSDVAQKVPQVKSHRFFLTAQQIVIVDPKDNKVADVIKLGTD